MRSCIAKLGIVLALMLGGLALPAPASAAPLPYNCQNQRAFNWNYSICRSGTGSYRSVVQCWHIWGTYYSYGPWKRVGSGAWSYTDCGMGVLRSYWVSVSS